MLLWTQNPKRYHGVKKSNNIDCLFKKCRLYVQLIGAWPFIVSNYRNLGFCRLFKLVLIVTRNFLLDSVSAVKITFIVESVINVCMVRHYLTRAMCDKLSWKFLLFPFSIVILVLWCSCFILSSTDLRHICQNLNQFGHGRGTIYGGRVDKDWMLTYLLKINCNADYFSFRESHQAILNQNDRQSFNS